MTPTVVELFAGGGGAHCGIRAAGCHTLACVEYDAQACETLRANGAPAVQADVNTWQGCAGERVDILWASPPCQPYSKGGLQLGADDPRDCWPGTLAQVRRLRPFAVIVENVKGAPAEAWADQLRALGYPYVAVWDLNAKDYGVPQSRPRRFVIASHAPHAPPRVCAPVCVADILPHLAGCFMRTRQRGNRSRSTNEICTTLTCDGGVWFYTVDPGPVGDTRQGNFRAPMGEKGGRASTPLEAGAIMGFPPGWVFTGSKERQYRQIGNAVPPPLAYAVVRAVLGVPGA